MATDLPRGWAPRRLFTEELNWGHIEGMSLTVFLLAAAAFMLALPLIRPAGLTLQTLAISLVAVGVFAPPAPVFYAMKGMRGAVWEDGFRPSATWHGFRGMAYARRRFRGKVQWGEVKRMMLKVDAERKTPLSLEVVIERDVEVRMSIRDPKNASSAEFPLLVIQRWQALGGPIQVEEEAAY